MEEEEEELEENEEEKEEEKEDALTWNKIGPLSDYPQRIRVCLSLWIQCVLDCFLVSKYYHFSPHPPLFSSATEL